MAITPDGTTMFVATTGDEHIYSHTIAANGSLGYPFLETSIGSPSGVQVSPDGKTLVVSQGSEVCAYPISSGHLGASNCEFTPSNAVDISIDPDSACVYAGEEDSRGVEVAALTLTGGVLGAPRNYNPFGPARDSYGILVSSDNRTIYVTNQISAQITTGSIKPGCQLEFRTTIRDGHGYSNSPGQIAEAQKPQGYVVTGNVGGPYGIDSAMGIFHVEADGKLTPVGSSQLPLTGDNHTPWSVVVVDGE